MTTTVGPRPARRTLRATTKALPEHTRAHNRAMVLQHLFHEGPSSRADLARATGLTRVTVSDLVGDLLAADLVEELGAVPQGKVGKPGTAVRMRTEEFAVVAVDLADDVVMRGAVLDLTGNVLERRATDHAELQGEDSIAALVGLCRELLDATTLPVIGIGIASPGVIDAAGTVHEAPGRGWFGVPLAERLATELGVPAHVANDANTAALGEYTFGGARGDGLLALTVGHGVGAGIILDGALVRGGSHAAGEIGHVTVVGPARSQADDGAARPGSDEPRLCACGRRGCLETILATAALRERLDGLDDESSDAVLASVGHHLGLALAPVVSALNLSEVLFCGPPELLDGPLARAALDTIQERTMPVTSTGLALRMATLGPDGALAGAAVLVLSGQLGVT